MGNMFPSFFLISYESKLKKFLLVEQKQTAASTPSLSLPATHYWHLTPFFTKIGNILMLPSEKYT